MDKKTIEYSAKIEMPDSGETIEIVGVSEEDIENQIANLFDYGLDTNGVYVGEEADS